MRTDLSPAFIAAKDAAARRPRQLLVFHFPETGVLRVSDQPLGAADGLADEYAGLVEEWGELLDMAGGDPMDYTAGEIRQASITLWNGGESPFSHRFLTENPENVSVDLYQWFAGLADSDKALIDTFVVQDPIVFDEVSHLLRLDLVSLSMRYDKPLGDLLTTDAWPNADPSALGKGIPLVLGTPGEVKTLYARTAPEATLNGSILATSTTIRVNESLDEKGFTASGRIQIGEELITYSSRTADTFTIKARGVTTTAAEHLDREKVVQKIVNHTFLVGAGPLSAINSVKAGGFAAPPEIYTVYPELDPARIVFTEKPYSFRFADAVTFLEMQFDLVNGDNTAHQAYLAYDAADQATAAMLSPLYPLLSLKQTTANKDAGEIVRVYLAVEHWESGGFLNDSVTVEVDGLGVVGTLSRPNPADTVDVVAEVDIDHGHTQSITGEHTHPFTDPGYIINDPTHGHAGSIASSTTYNSVDPIPNSLVAPYGSWGATEYFSFLGTPAEWSSGALAITLSTGAANVKVQIGWGVAGSPGYNDSGLPTFVPFYDQIMAGGTYTVGFGATQPKPYDRYNCLVVALSAYGNAYGATAAVTSAALTMNTNLAVSPATTGTTSVLQVSGASANQSAADTSVDDLAAANQPLQNVEADAATRTVVNLFDITEAVNFDWEWFTGREVRLTYQGTEDARQVYIAHCFFDIEFRRRERVFSDEVTCEPVGLIDDAAGTWTGSPLSVISRPDQVRKYLLCHLGGLPQSCIDAGGFAAAGSAYASLGYAFNGLLDASLTVREAEKRLAWQCRSRFFWNGGTAKIALRKKLADMVGCRELVPADCRIRSITAQRQRVADLVNSITLFYSRQWTSGESGPAGFTASVAGESNASISQHGTRENRDLFTFDLVTSPAMANDLLAFYLENLANPSTFYSFDAYLGQFDLEKEDCISLTSTFNKLRKANMVIRAADRAFGSGKLRRINYIRIVAESLRYILIEKALSDSARVIDRLRIELESWVLEFPEDIDLSDDQVFALLVLGNVESLSIEESLEVVFQVNEALADSATPSDILTIWDFAALLELQTVDDDLTGLLIPGFGGGGFGETEYGGPYIDPISVSDEALFFEALAVALIASRTDTATASDEPIIFSAGFGGNSISDGYGVTPFGG